MHINHHVSTAVTSKLNLSRRVGALESIVQLYSVTMMATKWEAVRLMGRGSEELGETDRQTETDRERDRDRQTESERDRQTDRLTDRDTERQMTRTQNLSG